MVADNWDVVVLTETWLNDSVLNAELFPPGYQIFRRDRCELHTGLSMGGGVLIAVASHIKVTRISQLENEGENIWFELEFRNKKSIIKYFKCVFPAEISYVCLFYISYYEKLCNYNFSCKK